jgi:hypothetical protein
VQTEWADYYDQNSSHYSGAAENAKRDAVASVLDRIRPQTLYDLGGNIGHYSRLASARGIYTVSFDIDPHCVHRNYERARRENDEYLLPLLTDLTNPTPRLGFDLRERESMLDRGEADLLMALALIHHLRITGNVPFTRLAGFLAKLGSVLLIEYVPTSDPMAQALLNVRRNTFHDYTEEGFQAAFRNHFDVEQTFAIPESSRVLYLFRRRV